MAELLCETHHRCALQRGQLEDCADCGARVDCLVKPQLSSELKVREQTFITYLCSEPSCEDIALVWLYPNEVEEYLRGVRIFAVSSELDEDGFPYARVKVK